MAIYENLHKILLYWATIFNSMKDLQYKPQEKKKTIFQPSAKSKNNQFSSYNQLFPIYKMRRFRLVHKKSIMQIKSVFPKSQQQQSTKAQDSAVNTIAMINVFANNKEKISQINQDSRKPLSWVLMALNMVAVLVSCFQSGYIIYAPSDHTNQIGYVFGAVLIFDIVVCAYTSFYLSEKWQILQIYLLLDNMLLVCIAASIGFVSFSNFRSSSAWYFDLVAFAFPIDFFLLIGNFRILLVRGSWSKCRIILYKFTLLICSILFFQIGVYFITVNYSYTNATDLNFDGQVKQLMLLNVFGTFSLIIQMYSKMTDLDHTGELQSTYQLKQFNDNEMANNLLEYSQLLKIRQEAQRKGFLKNQK